MNKTGRLILPNFKLYSEAALIKAVWHWLKDRHIDECNSIESSEIYTTDFS